MRNYVSVAIILDLLLLKFLMFTHETLKSAAILIGANLSNFKQHDRNAALMQEFSWRALIGSTRTASQSILRQMHQALPHCLQRSLQRWQMLQRRCVRTWEMRKWFRKTWVVFYFLIIVFSRRYSHAFWVYSVFLTNLQLFNRAR